MEVNQFIPTTLFASGKGTAHVVGLPEEFDVREELAKADSVHLATAYGHLSGWTLIEDAVLRCKGPVYLLTGLNHCLTEPALLANWLAAAREDAVFARVFDTPDTCFHPKVLLVNAESNDVKKLRFAIVGSGNLSRGGLLDNIEASAYVDRAESVLELKGWFEWLFTTATPITSDIISEYEPLYRRALRHEEKSRRAAHRVRKRLESARTTSIGLKAKKVIGEITAFHVVNTNIRYDSPDAHMHAHMLENHEACAYEEGWKEKIRNINEGDIVFLYRSQKWHPEVPGRPGIVAFGIATGSAEDRPLEDSCCMKLKEFHRLYPPISAEEITTMNGSPIAFGQVWQRPNREFAESLYREALNRCSW
jgi:HKD family nuclease